MASCGAFCSFCGRCGRRIAEEMCGMKPKGVAPPGVADKGVGIKKTREEFPGSDDKDFVVDVV